MDSWEKFELPVPLDKKHYYSKLNDSNISDKDIEHVKNVCDNLDPAYFLSAPGSSWQSSLKMTGQTLELLTDESMLLLLETGIRGGICGAITKYKKANNMSMKNYDKTKPSSYLMYVDANNLYGYAMSKKLPTGDFQCIEDSSIFTEDYMKNYDENSDTRYLLVVDVNYPKDLYEKHNYLPFLPEKIKIDKSTKLPCNFNDKNCYPIRI